MTFAEWLTYTPTIDEEFELEKTARCILEDDDHKEIAKLCSALVKQNFYQQKLLEQTIRHVAELDAIIACWEDVKPPKTWFQKLKERWGLTGC